MKGKRVQCKSIRSGELGTVTKRMGNCLWVKLDSGEEISGAVQYFKVIPEKRVDIEQAGWDARMDDLPCVAPAESVQVWWEKGWKAADAMSARHDRESKG